MTEQQRPKPNDLVRVLHFGSSYVGTVLVCRGDHLEAQFRVAQVDKRAADRYGDAHVRRATFNVNDVELIDRAAVSGIDTSRRSKGKKR